MSGDARAPDTPWHNGGDRRKSQGHHPAALGSGGREGRACAHLPLASLLLTILAPNASTSISAVPSWLLILRWGREGKSDQARAARPQRSAAESSRSGVAQGKTPPHALGGTQGKTNGQTRAQLSPCCCRYQGLCWPPPSSPLHSQGIAASPKPSAPSGTPGIELTSPQTPLRRAAWTAWSPAPSRAHLRSLAGSEEILWDAP